MGVSHSKRRKLSVDHDSFEILVRDHQGAIRAFLRRLTGNRAIADELAQDTFLKAYHHQDTWPEIKSMRSWLYRVAYRLFLDAKRKNDRRGDIAETGRAFGDLDDEAHSTGFTHTSSLAVDLAAAMNSLDPERRACVMLCLALGHSHRQAAQITGLPIGTVKSHVARARHHLQTRLEDYADVIT